MKKIIYFSLLLTIVAQGAWANDDKYTPTLLGGGKCQFNGPWVFESVKVGRYDNDMTTRSYNTLNEYAWGENTDYQHPITYQINNEDGMGFEMHCKSDWLARRYGVYSLYSHSESVPAYTCKRLTWTYKLRGYTNCHPQNVALYARDNMDDMKNTEVDFTHNYGNQSGSQYLLIHTTIGGSTGTTDRSSEAEQTKTFDFDNRNGSNAQVKTWALMLTHCTRNELTEMRNLHQYGRFKDAGYTWTTFYYKHVTFNANGGSGSMSVQTIENSGTLTANAFTREHYTFAGWATSEGGPVVYADGAAFTATANDKGPVTLYAVWNRVNYFISYDLNGGTATNPSSYTEATETFMLANPTRENSTFLGWTGSNGVTPEMTITIAQGSTGDKTFIAHWECETSTTVISLIDAIGEVEHTPESKAKIDAARAAYDALTAGEKADVPASKLETLRIAEATYAAEELSTIQFMNKDASQQIGSEQKAIYYPGANNWQTEQKNVSEDKTIVIKAVQ